MWIWEEFEPRWSRTRATGLSSYPQWRPGKGQATTNKEQHSIYTNKPYPRSHIWAKAWALQLAAIYFEFNPQITSLCCPLKLKLCLNIQGSKVLQKWKRGSNIT